MTNENKADDIFRNLKEGFGDFGQKVNKMVDDLFSGEDGSGGGEVRIRVDVYEAKDQFVLELELPGVSKDAVNVHINDGILSIKGEKKPATVGGKASYLLRERRMGSFLRNFTLPDYVDITQIKAKYESGLLTIRLPIIREEEEDDDQATDIIID